MTVLELACLVCGCTDQRACLDDKGTPCSWTECSPPVCSQCAATKAIAGKRVTVIAGKWSGRTGIVRRVPGPQYAAWRYVDLDERGRTKARREFINLGSLREVEPQISVKFRSIEFEMEIETDEAGEIVESKLLSSKVIR